MSDPVDKFIITIKVDNTKVKVNLKLNGEYIEPGNLFIGKYNKWWKIHCCKKVIKGYIISNDNVRYKFNECYKIIE